MIVGDETEQLHLNKDDIPVPIYEWRFTSMLKVFYYFFGFAWHNAFGNAWFQFVVANATCFWYFKQGSEGIGISPIWTSFKRSLYHWGSICLGSLVIGLFGFLKPVLGYIHVKIG